MANEFSNGGGDSKHLSSPPCYRFFCPVNGNKLLDPILYIRIMYCAYYTLFFKIIIKKAIIIQIKYIFCIKRYNSFKKQLYGIMSFLQSITWCKMKNGLFIIVSFSIEMYEDE